MTDPPSRRPRAAMVALAAVTLGALALRFVASSRHGLWGDEGFSLLMARVNDIHVWKLDQHPPLYYALLQLWSGVVTSDAGLRGLSILLGTAAIPAVYALGVALFTRSVGLWAAAIVAVSWMHAHHSRELRMYPLMVLCSALMLLGLVRGARDGRRAGWVLYAIAGALLAWSHAVGAVYVAIAAALAWMWVGEPSPERTGQRRAWLWSTAAIGIAFAPWLSTYLSRIRGVAEQFWIPPSSLAPPLFTTILDLLLRSIPAPGAILYRHLGVGSGSLLGRWVWMTVVLAALALVLTRPPSGGGRAVGFLAIAYVAPIALLAAASALVRPILIPRLVLPALVPLAVLLGAVAATPGRRCGRLAAGAVLAVAALGGLYGVRYDTGYYEEWRELSQDLQERAAPGDVVLLVGGHSDARPHERRHIDRGGKTARLLLGRYDIGGKLARLPQPSIADLAADCPLEIDPCLVQRLGAYAPGTTVWLVRFGSGATAEVEPWMLARLERHETWDFKGPLLERASIRSVLR